MVGTKAVRVLCGVPGSGKSTWVTKEVMRLEEEQYTTAVISRDAIRFALLGDSEDYFAHETEVFEEFVRQINEAIELGINYVFVDQTSITPGSRKKLLSRLTPNTDTQLWFDILEVPVEVAFERNENRSGRAFVPKSVIRRMHNQFVRPTMSEFANNMYGFNGLVLHEIGSDN